MQMHLVEVVEKAKEEILSVMNLEMNNVISCERTEEGWRLAAELIERKSLPDTQDILGIYEVLLDDDGNMTGYDRKKVRRRQDLEEEYEV